MQLNMIKRVGLLVFLGGFLSICCADISSESVIAIKNKTPVCIQISTSRNIANRTDSSSVCPGIVEKILTTSSDIKKSFAIDITNYFNLNFFESFSGYTLRFIIKPNEKRTHIDAKLKLSKSRLSPKVMSAFKQELSLLEGAIPKNEYKIKAMQAKIKFLQNHGLPVLLPRKKARKSGNLLEADVESVKVVAPY